MHTFDDEDIFRQFDQYPHSATSTSASISTSTSHHNNNNNINNNDSLRQTISKDEILDILSMIQTSLERAWLISCGGRKRRLKKLEVMKELRQKIESCPEDVNLSMVLEHAVAPTSCVPPLFGRNTERMMERHLGDTLQFLNAQMHHGGGSGSGSGSGNERGRGMRGEESDEATIGDSFVDNDEDLEMMMMSSAHSHISSEASSVFTDSNYDADSEKISHEEEEDDDEYVESDESGDVVMTTCNVESEHLGALGLSITTWSRRKLNNESIRSLSGASIVSDAAVATDADADAAVHTSGSDDDDDDEGDTVEEVSLSIGNNIVVRASTRQRSVTFTGIKPTSEDNITRALELLKKYKNYT